nr:MAG TPA: hypothetical protein [Caudoviricetes sp.]
MKYHILIKFCAFNHWFHDKILLNILTNNKPLIVIVYNYYLN